MTDRFSFDGAACNGRSDIFLPRAKDTDEIRSRREADAKQVCAHCPIAAGCREEALAHHRLYLDLVMGGLTYIERESLLRRHRKQRASARA